MREIALRLLLELPGPPPGAGDAPQRAEEILSRPEYRPPRRHLLDRILDWIADRFPSVSTASAGGNRLVSIVVATVFIALLIFVLSRLRFRVPASTADDGDLALAIEVEEVRSADEWRNEAERCEASGEWKLALRARFRWLIGELAEKGAVADTAGRTAGEFRVEIGDRMPDAAAAFAAATDLFELAWYGNEATGADENARFRAYAERVLAARPAQQVAG